MATADRSGQKSSMPKKGGGGLDLSGLTDALGGVVGGLTNTLGQAVGAVGGLVGGVLGSLLGPLQQLKLKAQQGDEESAQAYDQAVTMLQNSASKGKTDAQELLKQLGEALDEDEPQKS